MLFILQQDDSDYFWVLPMGDFFICFEEPVHWNADI